MLNVDNQSVDVKSLENENVVRQLGPELDSELATPQRDHLQQRLFSESVSQHNEELNALGMSKKLLKSSQSTSQILLGDDDNTLTRRYNPVANASFSNSKENFKPGFLNRPQKNQKIAQRVKKGKNRVVLTPEEEFKLIEAWEKNYFIDFNSWLQIAKAKVSQFPRNILPLLSHIKGSKYPIFRPQFHPSILTILDFKHSN